MGSTVVCIAALALGIDVGWQPLPKEGMEYIIQIPPQSLDTLAAGEILRSDVPREVKDIRRYRILVGTATLPRRLPAAAQPAGGGPLLLPREVPSKPIAEQKAAFVETQDMPAKPPSQPAGDPRPQPAEPAKPWTLLTLVVLGLFASLGGNVYLGWIFWDIRQRFRALLTRESAGPT